MTSRVLPENITPEALQELIDCRIPEGQTIEFKREINLATWDGQKKFLLSVAAFANASGGDIIFGAEESGGVIKSFVGLGDFDPDKMELQLAKSSTLTLSPLCPALSSLASN